ncbi:hypothetical protein ACO3UB_08475 (plasmid) [Methanocaldococcus sp. 16A]
MNYTKYVIFLVIFNCVLAVLDNINTFSGEVPHYDLATAQEIGNDTSSSASSLISSATFLADTLFLIFKVVVLAPFYSALLLYQLGVHPVIAAVWGVANAVLYAMWIIDLRRNVPFLR